MNVDVTAAGPVRRRSQGNATIGSALRRYYTRLTGSLVPYGYWSTEDAQGALRRIRLNGAIVRFSGANASHGALSTSSLCTSILPPGREKRSLEP